PGEPFPLTRVQHAYWIGRAGGFDLGGVGCHFYYEHDAAGLDVERYEAAWNRLIARHGMLRAVVTAEGENVVLESVPRYRIPVTDCRDAPPERCAEVLAGLRARLEQRVAPGDRWPLVEVHVVLLPGGTARVALSVDVLVLDSASYMVLDRELATLYRDPDAELPPIGVTFAECVAAVQARAGSPAHRRAEAYWHARLETLPPAPALPAVAGPGAPRFTRRRAEIRPEHWTRLQARAAELGVTPTAVLLAAYADVLAAWSGDERFTITLTVFDRPPIHPDVDKVVGEFSSLLLLEIDRTVQPTPAGRARAVQERLFADLDHREYSGLEVLAEQARRTGEQRNVPVVFTGMLGLQDLGGPTPHEHDWLGPVVYGVSQTPQAWLDHQVFELRGALVLQWDLNEAVLDAAAAGTAFAAYERWLTRLAEDPGVWDDPAAGPRLDEPPTGATADPDGGGDGEDAALTTDRTGRRDAGPGTAGPDPGGPGGTGSGDAVAQLAAVWGELLGLDPAEITPDATFLTLGGDSLLAVRMAAEIRRRLGVGLALPQIRPTLTIAELADLVRARPGDPARRGTTVRMRRRLDRDAPFGLLPLQQAYFVGQYGGYELSYPSVHAYTDILLRGVDPDAAPAALDDAVRRVVAHQPMLRARLLPDGTQRILPVDDQSVYAPVRTLDLRSASPEEARRRLDALREEMTRSGPDPTTGAGYDVRLTFLPGGEGRLHVSLSLLTCDGWSGAVFDREMFTYVTDPNVVLPPLLVDFGDYVRAMDRLRETPEWRADRDWWTARLPELPDAPPVPTVRDPGEVDAAMMGMREFRLDGESWSVLRAACARRNVTPASALAGAYAEALARLTGEPRFLLTSLQFHRVPLHADVDRMIGPFSSTALLAVELTGAGTFGDVAARLQAEVGDSLAHNLVSGVEVARELARLRGTRRPLAPVVFQSTLGLDGALGGDLPRSAGPLGELVTTDYWQQVRTPQVWLECRVFELREQLVVNFAVVEELFAPGVVDGLVAEVQARVASLVDGSGWECAVQLPAPGGPAGSGAVAGAGATGTAAGTGTARHPAPGPPADELERTVARTWAAVLGEDLCDAGTVDRTADFFALGGDSLLAVRMLTRLAAGHGHAPSPREFLAAPTIAGLAAALQARDTGGGADAGAGAGGGAGAGSGPDARIAVPLAEGSRPDRTPLFLLHPSGGDVVCYA
ncbi:MAG TPA: condensation domain-containing protein, partial [Pseudonocardia sp.]|nr:condensation domain-containing protein [Pseudonocardia sp.]